MEAYTSFYGFSENPFPATPDPKFFFLSESHREVVASIRYGITERKGFILVSGGAGTGKTSLIRHLASNLGPKVRTVIIDRPHVSPEQLLKDIVVKIGLPLGDHEKGALIRQLNEYLIQNLARQENLAILIDEAQNLSKESMEELRLLSNLETSSSKLVQIVLVGQPEIVGKLNSRDLRQFKQRIVIRSEIRGWNEEDSRKYIDHRLNLVGSNVSEVFTPRALHLIFRFSKGIPGSINTLCDQALQMGYGLGRKKIDASIVKRARKTHSRKVVYTILVLAALMLAIFLGRGYIKSVWQREPEQSPIRQPIADQKVAPLQPEIQTGFPSKESPSPASGEKGRASRPPQPGHQPSWEQPEGEMKGKKIVKVEQGDTLSSLSEKHYKLANITLLDRILIANPRVMNPHLIQAGQNITLPEIGAESLILKFSERGFKIHLGTFMNAENAGEYRKEPSLKNKEIEIAPRKISPKETWHRVMAGNFDTREECLKIIQALREKGLLPALFIPQ